MSCIESLQFRRVLNDTGYTKLVSPPNSPLSIISLDILRMHTGNQHTFEADNMEKVLVILGGICEISCGEYHEKNIGERESPFKGRGSALYIPPTYTATIVAKTPAEIIIAKAPSSLSNLLPKVIRPDDVRKKEVGKGNWSRQVYNIVAGDFPADRLIVGETINPPGNWSSSPPHKHDRHNPPHESQFEEVYFYRIEPSQGFGLQRVYTDEGNMDVCYVVQENDVVVLPRGYHPVVAGPGYRLYYLWVLAGRGRNPVWFEDPIHSWIHNPGHSK